MFGFCPLRVARVCQLLELVVGSSLLGTLALGNLHFIDPAVLASDILKGISPSSLDFHITTVHLVTQ